MEEKKLMKWQDGDYTVARTTAWSAPGCHNGCGVLLYIKDGKVEKVEGDPEHPFNQGALCPRCPALPKVMYNERRLTHPMKRKPGSKKGEGEWEEISWDEAYDLIEKGFKDVIEKYGPCSVMGVCGTARDVMTAPFRLVNSMGSPNYSVLQSGSSCYIPRAAASSSITGTSFPVADCSQYFEDRYDHEGWVLPKYIMIVGCNAIYSNPDYFFGHWIVECMKRGSKLIVVDPRVTWLAAHAEYHLQLRPGTDTALAMAMCNVIVEEDLYDHDFIENWSFGFEDWCEAIEEYTPEVAEEITWVPAQTIRAAARAFATESPSTIQIGVSTDQSPTGVATAQCLIQMAALTGNYDVPGGMIPVQNPFNIWYGTFGGWGQELLTQEVLDMRVGTNKYPAMKYGMPLNSPDEIFETLATDDPYPIRAIWFNATNQIVTNCSSPHEYVERLKKIEFCAGADIFMTPWIEMMCDVVLPACCYPERDSWRVMFYNANAIIKQVEAPGDCRDDWQICLDLGKRFNPEAWPWETTKDIFEDLFAQAGGKITYKELCEKGVMYDEYVYKKYEKGLMRPDGEPGFNTPTMKFEFFSVLWGNFGLHPLPYFVEPVQSPANKELAEKYPYLFMTGVRSKVFFHSEHRQVDILREIHPQPYVEIHPDLAAELDLHDGEWVWCENDRGRCKQTVKITQAVHPRMVNANYGWWFPEQGDEGAKGLWGYDDVNSNNLTVMGLQGETGFGADLKSVMCRIYKVREGE